MVNKNSITLTNSWLFTAKDEIRMMLSHCLRLDRERYFKLFN